MQITIRRRWKLIVNAVTFIALAGMIFVLRRQIIDAIGNLQYVNGWALLLMIPFQFLNYHSYAIIYQDLFKTLGKKIDYKPMLRIVLELNFVNNVFPSGGLSGFSYFGLRMRSQEVNPGLATLVQMMRFALLFISFQALVFIGLLTLASVGDVNNLTILISGSLATLSVVLTVVTAYIIGSKKRIRSFFTFITLAINRIIQIVRPKHPETLNVGLVQEMFNELHLNYVLLKSDYRRLARPLVYSFWANVGEVATIYSVYVAFGHFVNPGAVIIAYAVANFAGLISVLPGGVGIYEVLMTAMLVAAGVPPALAIPVTVMYRILNMLIQLPIGYYFYHQAVLRGK